MPKRRSPATENPLPTTLEDALQEIFRLQAQLKAQNEQRANAAEKYAREIRSVKGELKRPRKKLAAPCPPESDYWDELDRLRLNR